MMHYLKSLSNDVMTFDERVRSIENDVIACYERIKSFKNDICVLVGHCQLDAVATPYSTKNELATITNLDGFGYQESISNLVQEIKEMIIELKIKGSIRQRDNGLIELRTSAFGSIYGRTKAEVEQKLLTKLKEANKGKKIKHTAPLLSEFYRDNYLPYKLNQNRAENTIKGIESNFKYIVEQGFDKPLTAYKSQEIESFLYSIEKTRKRQVIQGLLNNMFDRALTLSLVKANPCTPIEKMQHTQDKGEAFSFEEQIDFFTRLFDSNKLTYQDKCYFIFVYLTGARRDGAIRVKEDDIHKETNILDIHESKTNTSDRSIPLFSRVAKLLSTLPIKNGAYIDLPYDRVGKKFDEVYDKHKIHDLRHTFGTIQICVEKVNVKTVSLWLGHSNINTTLQTYTHPEQLDKGTFLRGDLTEDEKIAVYRSKYQEVLQLIDNFLQ